MSNNGREGKTAIIIPARMDSQRLPGKPLKIAGGKSLIQWTYEAARQTTANYVIVATPDKEIAQHCDSLGIWWRPTHPEAPNGTARCAEVIAQMKLDNPVTTVINWQVDEPLVDPQQVERMLKPIPKGLVYTLAAPLTRDQYLSHETVKVAVTSRNWCLWFSRALMQGCLGHCGVYSFSPETLLRLGSLGPSKLSIAESLEQLTWLEQSRTSVIAYRMLSLPLSINTPNDWDLFLRIKASELNVN